MTDVFSYDYKAPRMVIHTQSLSCVPCGRMLVRNGGDPADAFCRWCGLGYTVEVALSDTGHVVVKYRGNDTLNRPTPDISMCESEPEKMLYEALEEFGGPHPLEPQHKVGPYRLDLAVPHLRIGVEVDGLAYHNGQESFMRDRARQRWFELQGWFILRFAAKEVMDNPSSCAEQVNAFCESIDPDIQPRYRKQAREHARTVAGDLLSTHDLPITNGGDHA